MSIRSLKAFLAAAEGSSFAAAARTVNRTQSSITVQVKALEDALGRQLFDRSKRPPVLTEDGRTFLPHAVEAVAAYDRLFRGPVAEQGTERRLRIGAIPSIITSGILPRALAALRNKHPNVHVEIAMGVSTELMDRARLDIHDAIIVSEAAEIDSRFNWVPLFREPLVLIAPMDAPNRPAEELIEIYPFIRYSRQIWVGALIDRTLRQHKLRVRETMVLDTLEAIVSVVHHGLGVSIVTLGIPNTPFLLPVRQVPLQGRPVERVVGLAYGIGHPRSTLIEALRAELMALTSSEKNPPFFRKPSKKRRLTQPAS